MRNWILAIALIALAAILTIRELVLSSQIKSLDQSKEAGLAQYQEVLDRLDRLEQSLHPETEQARVEPRGLSAPGVADSAEVLRRIQGLEKEIARLNAKINPEYDPTISTSEPEPDAEPGAKRNWGPEQIIRPPDVDREGDSTAAWAALQTDSGPEWLSAGFAKTVEVAQVRIRESYNAGAITNISAMLNGAEIPLWQGNSARGKTPRDFVISAPPGIQANSIIVHLDTHRVSGWNEIDAIELVGRDGSRQWASSASASSSYADRAVAAQPVDSGLLIVPRTQ